MEDKIREPEEIDRLDLEKYGLSHLKDRNILALGNSEINELLDALGYNDISLNIPMTFSPYNVDGMLSYSDCRRCGRCCLPNELNPGNPGVEVLEDELKNIAIHLQVSYESLMEKTLEGKSIHNQDQPDNVTATRFLPLPCPFYNEELNQCQVYEARPIVCSVYPIVFGEHNNYIAVKVDCDYGRDIAVRSLLYLKTNNPGMGIKL
ncbi:YkgJ family cysteine cluster protein [Chloroflexota bacterium]